MTQAEKMLAMFRGGKDTKDIAFELRLKESQVYNTIRRQRELERKE